jgi:ABC-type thiamine transport system ATPase subunit
MPKKTSKRAKPVLLIDIPIHIQDTPDVRAVLYQLAMGTSREQTEAQQIIERVLSDAMKTAMDIIKLRAIEISQKPNVAIKLNT